MSVLVHFKREFAASVKNSADHAAKPKFNLTTSLTLTNRLAIVGAFAVFI